jgi:DNA polymerase I-like protein with 3'-5' exonuclease and polymerase domains
VQYCFGSEYNLEELVNDIAKADFVVAHNAKFELGWLRRCGVDLRRVVTFDTLIADYVLGGNRFALHELGLSACLKRHGLEGKKDLVSALIKNGVPTEDIPESWLLDYCIRDVEAAGELFLRQRALLKDRGLEAVNYQRNLVTPALTDIEFNGMQLDNVAVTETLAAEELRYERLTTKLQQYCGGASPSSPKQMRQFIFGDLGFNVPRDFRGHELLTPAGDPSVAAPILAQLVATTKRQRGFLSLHTTWRQLHSDITKYLRKFGECVDVDGGLLRASFNQCSTRTHRLSSTGLQYRVQFQNLNRNFKPLFTTRNSGWVMGEADGAQLEFRVAAHLGRDRVALSDIVQGTDIHSYTASIIGCSRQEAKPHTFKPLYGGTSGSPNEQAYYKAFKEKYRSIADTQQGWTQQVLRDKHLTTEWGLRYYWPDTHMKKSGYITNTTSIYNYPVQALATAEIIPCAIVAAWHRMKDASSFLVNTVHDSIIAEIAPNEKELWHCLAKQCLIVDCYNMISQLYGVNLTVPLGAGVMVGTHWSNKEAKDSEVVYEAPEELWKPAAIKEGMI